MSKNFLSGIMKRAWSIVKEMQYDISTALRLAWFEAKNNIKKAYAFKMDETRRGMIETYTTQLTCSILTNAGADIHDIHKSNVIREALQAPVKNNMIVTDGKTVGLLKYAMRQVA